MIVYKKYTWMADGTMREFLLPVPCVGESILLVNKQKPTIGYIVQSDKLIFDEAPERRTLIELTYEVDYGAPREFNGGISYEGDL